MNAADDASDEREMMSRQFSSRFCLPLHSLVVKFVVEHKNCEMTCKMPAEMLLRRCRAWKTRVFLEILSF